MKFISAIYMSRRNSTKNFPSQEGGLRTIRKTEPEENNGILKNPFHTLHKEPKGITYVGFFFPNDRNQTFCQDIECHTNFRQF